MTHTRYIDYIAFIKVFSSLYCVLFFFLSVLVILGHLLLLVSFYLQALTYITKMFLKILFRPFLALFPSEAVFSQTQTMYCNHLAARALPKNGFLRPAFHEFH